MTGSQSVCLSNRCPPHWRQWKLLAVYLDVDVGVDNDDVVVVVGVVVVVVGVVVGVVVVDIVVDIVVVDIVVVDIDNDDIVVVVVVVVVEVVVVGMVMTAPKMGGLLGEDVEGYMEVMRQQDQSHQKRRSAHS